jgi:hypothetical protein
MSTQGLGTTAQQPRPRPRPKSGYYDVTATRVAAAFGAPISPMPARNTVWVHSAQKKRQQPRTMLQPGSIKMERSMPCTISRAQRQGRQQRRCQRGQIRSRQTQTNLKWQIVCCKGQHHDDGEGQHAHAHLAWLDRGPAVHTPFLQLHASKAAWQRLRLLIRGQENEREQRRSAMCLLAT